MHYVLCCWQHENNNSAKFIINGLSLDGLGKEKDLVRFRKRLSFGENNYVEEVSEFA